MFNIIYIVQTVAALYEIQIPTDCHFRYIENAGQISDRQIRLFIQQSD